MNKKFEIPEVGPWASDKLSKLRKYLQAYATILSKQKGKGTFEGFVFVDAFAGPGRATVREARGTAADEEGGLFGTTVRDAEAAQVLDGSPRVALSIEPAFTAYVFLEKSPGRRAELEKLKEEFGTRRIRIEAGDCNTYLREKLAKHVNWQRWRAVVFLDPFGMQVPWATIQALGSTAGIEIILNLPVGMAIQRLLKRTGKFSAKERRRLDDYFGDSGWDPLLYEHGTDLFGEPRVAKQETAERQLLDWYRERLRKVFGEVSEAYLVCNTKGAHLYYLIWAGRNATGLKIANHVLSSGTKVGRSKR
jgi:three-Cys-motif partner protein